MPYRQFHQNIPAHIKKKDGPATPWERWHLHPFAMSGVPCCFAQLEPQSPQQRSCVQFCVINLILGTMTGYALAACA
jgi:hypothetical protein